MKRILEYIPKTEKEKRDKELMVVLLQDYPEQILYRSLLFAHLSASAMIFNPTRDKVLMIYHNIFHNWTMTGGHMDGVSDLLVVALKEAKEETGIKTLKLLTEDILSIEVLPVNGHYKNGEYVPAHLHLNATFGFEANEEEPLRICGGENSGVAWLPITDLNQYSNEFMMLEVFQKCIERVEKEQL